MLAALALHIDKSPNKVGHLLSELGFDPHSTPWFRDLTNNFTKQNLIQSCSLIPNGFQHNAEILFRGLFNLVFRSKYWDKMPVKLRMKSIFLKENHPKQFRILAIQQQFPSACLNRKFRNEILQTYWGLDQSLSCILSCVTSMINP